MVGKTYLRYVVGPQGGSIASNAALTVDSAIIQPQYRSGSGSGGGSRMGSARTSWRGGPAGRGGAAAVAGGRQQSSSSTLSASTAAVLFVPSLEAVRVLSVRSGATLHTLIPASAKTPLEVTSLRVCALPRGAGGASFSAQERHAGGSGATTTAAAEVDVSARTASEGWMLLVGYGNGCVAVFTCSAIANYGKPVCRFYSLGHKVDTNVLALAADEAGVYACSGGQDTDLTVWDLMAEEAAFRLRGHRGGVVALQFVPQRACSGGSATAAAPPSPSQRQQQRQQGDTLLVSAAADGLVKVWNVSLRVCVQTVIASDAQVTAMAMDCEGRRLYCGVRESFIRVYRLDGDEAAGSASDDVLVDHGTIPRRLEKPVTSLHFSADWGYLLAASSKSVEVFKVMSSEETRKKRQRKRQRRQKAAPPSSLGAVVGSPDASKRAKTERTSPDKDGDGGEDGEEANGWAEPSQQEESAAEEVALLRTFFLSLPALPSRKVRAACFVPPLQSHGEAESTLHIAVTFNNNSVQTYETTLAQSDAAGGATWTLTDLKARFSYDQQAHQSDIRALAFVDNDAVLLSMSREKVLSWTLRVQESRLDSDHIDSHDYYDAQEENLSRVDFRGSLNCSGCVMLHGIGGGATAAADGVAMCAITASMCGVGLSDGTVALLDVPSSESIFCEAGYHTGGVQALTKRPDDSGFLSAGADRRLVLWTVGLLRDNKTATLLAASEVELTSLPLFAAFSPDNHYLGVGLQNNNLQLFFADTLKPYLSLFGHKLPPTAISFSTDGTLAASVGTDKSLRFWGTDFGNCHRAIHAHDDYVTAVEFVRSTHYVFTVSLDGTVKQWDGDNWTMIQCLRQHPHGLWAVSITKNATCVATAGADKCIRCFLRTQDIVFPEEEEERMGQEAVDEEVARRAAVQKLDAAAANGGASAAEVGVAGLQTAATAEAAERLMEALDIVSVEQQRQSNPDDAGSAKHPLLATMTEWEYLWSVIASIRPSELRHTLAALTSVHVDALLTYVERMVEERAALDYEIAAKVVLSVVLPSAVGAGGEAALALRTTALRGDAAEVVAAKRLRRLRQGITAGLDRCVSRMDYNVAGLQFVRQHLQDSARVTFFDRSKVQGYRKKYHSRALPTKKE